eukprot:CAMPEP_0194036672 /NCGR_PEP_ID=MMETSP0009_2-20130614/9033_1 /TAXON_ID=210454 /ORGANISM="Grammatophora oceanica, Strain CCMP 410" /LENGTH=61 /DNA_ID=CAMNT_0038678523 /DNA_START=9 /DNA_END=191 /DNA_ORIENTATION=+
MAAKMKVSSSKKTKTIKEHDNLLEKESDGNESGTNEESASTSKNASFSSKYGPLLVQALLP